MIGDTIYNFLIIITLISKLIWFLVDFIYFYKKNTGASSKIITQLKTLNDYMLTFTELLMYIVIAIIFSPHKNPRDIILTKHEQLIAFIIGILGIIHTNWNLLRSFILKLFNKNIRHQVIQDI